MARVISDVGMGEFRRQLEYEAKLNGCQIIVAARWYPSSKTCSDCQHVIPELTRGAEFWDRPNCGIRHDREMNATINLENLAASYVVSACRAISAGDNPPVVVKLAALE
jgi:putative transposase